MPVYINSKPDIFFSNTRPLEWIKEIVVLLPLDPELEKYKATEWEIIVLNADCIIIRRQLCMTILSGGDEVLRKWESVMISIENNAYRVLPQTGRDEDNVATVAKSAEEAVKQAIAFLKIRATDLYVHYHRVVSELRDTWGIDIPEIPFPKNPRWNDKPKN